MSALLTLIKGFPGKPSHAPLTDVSVGAYTVGVAALIAGALGFEEEATAKAALLAISVGLIVAVPTSLTGLLDWADISKGTAKRKLANFHLLVMVAATTVFALTWLAQRPGYDDGEVTTLGLALGVGAFGLLILGGTLGGALAYVYGVRVVKKDVSLVDALIPGRISEGGGRTQSAQKAVKPPPPPAQPTAAAPSPVADPADPADPASTAAYAGAQAARYRL
ncbi:MAG TPA: DUF2231 domain-containing protein [Solirubrobacteraceae bacterium]|nr:DUF2231 domain-containing protein [Solirubrobacteraceae bacterium]